MWEQAVDFDHQGLSLFAIFLGPLSIVLPENYLHMFYHFFLLLLSWVEREAHSTSHMWWANYPSQFEFWKAVLYNRYKIIDLYILPFPSLVHYCNWLFSLKKLFVWKHDVSKHLYFKKLFCYPWTHTDTTQN